MRFVCEWEREDSPTRGMSETESRAYYKAHVVEGDCRFALRPGHGKPDDITAVWQALLDRVIARGKETPDDRKVVAALRMAWREWSDGLPYAKYLPTVEPVTKPKRAPKVQPAIQHPHGVIECPCCHIKMAKVAA